MGGPRGSLAHLRRLGEAILAEPPVHVELHHAFQHKPVALDFRVERDICFVNAYLPKLPGPPLPTSCAMTPIGYVCFLGRDTAQWWGQRDGSERCDHDCSRGELLLWVPHPRGIVGRTRLTFGIVKSCRAGKSAKDAIKVMDLLGRPLWKGRFAGEAEKKLFT